MTVSFQNKGRPEPRGGAKAPPHGGGSALSGLTPGRSILSKHTAPDTVIHTKGPRP